MANKIFRLFTKDTQLKTFLILLAFVVAVFVFLVKKTHTQKIELTELQSKKGLVAMLPKMEAKVRSEQLKVKENIAKEEGKESKLVLSGIFVEKDKKIALINGTIYREGDSIENYIIMTITIRSVILKQNSSSKVIQLSL